MNLDLAIQNQVMGRSPMDNAMYGVASDLGDGHYRLNAFHESEEIATSLMGSPLASYTPHPISAHVRPPIQPASEPTPQSFTEKVGADYSVSYDSGSKTWTLSKETPKSGILGALGRLFGRQDMESTSLVSKSGANSLHRFLTTVESMDLPNDVKGSIATVAVNATDTTGISEYVGGHTIQSDIDNPIFSDITYEDPVSILASEYVRPKTLTGFSPVRNEIGDKFGTQVTPQTHIPSSQISVTAQMSRPF